MTLLSNDRLAKQIKRMTESEFYSDTGFVIKKVSGGTYDAYNQPVTTDSEIPVACAFTDSPSRERWQDIQDVENVDAEVRFVATKPEKGDRFKIVSRFASDAYTDVTFEIIGIRNRGTLGYVCALRRVQV